MFPIRFFLHFRVLFDGKFIKEIKEMTAGPDVRPWIMVFDDGSLQDHSLRQGRILVG
jgi:hypothetical protein